jgi:hypothetical protein
LVRRLEVDVAGSLLFQFPLLSDLGCLSKDMDACVKHLESASLQRLAVGISLECSFAEFNLLLQFVVQTDGSDPPK